MNKSTFLKAGQVTVSTATILLIVKIIVTIIQTIIENNKKEADKKRKDLVKKTEEQIDNDRLLIRGANIIPGYNR